MADKAALQRGLQILGSLHISGAIRNQSLETLSPGELTKVELVRLVLVNPELLILDEPTNHLSLMDLRALESALKDFSGAIVVVSHDLVFLERLGCRVIDLEPCRY